MLALGFDHFGTYGPTLTALIVLPVAVGLLATFARVPDGGLHRRIRARMADHVEPRVASGARS